MKYVLDISPSAEEALDRIFDETEDEGLFDAMDALFEEIAKHPVTVMRRYPRRSGYPYAVGWHGHYMFLTVFRFKEGEKRIEILGVAYVRIGSDPERPSWEGGSWSQ